MLKIKSLALVALVGTLAACNQAPDSDTAEVSDAQEVSGDTGGETYRVDPAASSLAWIGTKVSGTHSGEVKIKSGELTVANGAVTGGNFVLDMGSIRTTGPKGSSPEWDAKLDGHLKSGDFFDVEKYPDAKFEVTKVEPFNGAVQEENDPRQEDLNQFKVTNPTHTVSGNLTMKDQTRNVTFPARINVSGNEVTALAKFNVDRKEWGLVYTGKPDDLIADQVHFGINLKATK